MSSIIRFLSDDQRKRVCEELLSDLSNQQNVQGLIELLDTFDDEALVGKIGSTVEGSLVEDLSGSSDELIRLLVKIPKSMLNVLNRSGSLILSYLSQRRNMVLAPDSVKLFDAEFEQHSGSDVEPDFSLENTLMFLEKVYSLGCTVGTSQLDKLVIFTLCVLNEQTTLRATKVLRWRNVADEELQRFTWDVIPLLINSSKDYHVTGGFILWLRFMISTSKNNTQSKALNTVIQTDEYWQWIQEGLTSSVHEHRKYCLSILKLSIQLLSTNVDNNLISFHIDRKAEIQEDWKRFCTLYEIVGVDTALNQAIAAQGDIVQLLSRSSRIKPSWGLALLCTGFKGNMEAVRKYSLELMYSVPGKDLSIFAHDFLSSIFLKYALEGSHFQVKKVQSTFQCEYGERLERFISNVIRSLKKSAAQLESVVRNIMALLANITTTYAPSRFYLASGLLKGLKGLHVLDSSMAQDLHKLFESTAEDDVCEIALQTVHLRLVKHLMPDIPLLLETLTRFVQYNGYELYMENIEFFHDYVSMYCSNVDVAFATREVEFQVIYYSLFNQYSLSDDFLKGLAKSGIELDSKLTTSFSEYLSSLVQGEALDYSNTTHLVQLDMFKNSWGSVKLDALYKSVLKDLSIDKLVFFSAIFAKVSDCSDVQFFQFEQIEELYTALTSLKLDFKDKDVVASAFINIILAFLKMIPVSSNQVARVLEILTLELKNGVFKAYTSTCLVLQLLFKSYDDVDLISSMDILESIWDQITAERLILSQREMHLTFIDTLFDQKLLRDSINNEFNAKMILKIGNEIISVSQTRRCLLPRLSLKLLQYQRAFPSDFEVTEWIPELIINLLTLIQDNTNMFRIKNVLASKYDTELSMGTGDLYSKVYGPQEISTKVNIVSILCKVSSTFCDSYWQRLLDRFVVAKKRTDGTEELQRVYAFASLLLLSMKVSCELLDSSVQLLLSKLEKESSPWIRAYMEWICSINIIRSATNRSTLFNLFEDQGKPTLVTSSERIGFLVSQKLTGDERFQFFDEFTQKLIPNCASNKPLVRHFSNSLILSLYPEIESKGLKLPVNDILKCLFEEAKKSEITGKYRTGDALLWDVYEDFNLISIFGGVLCRISPREYDVITKDEFELYINDKESLSVPIGEAKHPRWSASENSDKATATTTEAQASPLQTKSGAWESVLDIDENARVVKRSDLIVVSSLVDKPPNLGGICRLCDVLGAGCMTVDDLRVKSHPQFKNVAVTADYWMPMEEVKIEDIAHFMREKKKEGYTLIGLEQTDKSIVLGRDTTFPKKSLFLLGKEAEGIPGDLLAELDWCVEIRQVGVIRSMNIQTATAVLVHAYATCCIE